MPGVAPVAEDALDAEPDELVFAADALVFEPDGLVPAPDRAVEDALSELEALLDELPEDDAVAAAEELAEVEALSAMAVAGGIDSTGVSPEHASRRAAPAVVPAN